MDATVRHWILEFLLGNSEIDTKLVMDLIYGDVDSCIKKALLLRYIGKHLSSVSIPESILDIFEVLEEVHRREGSPVTAAMSAAYCSVAVECTLKFLKLNVPAYHNAVRRIWLRVPNMEPVPNVEGSLFSAEFMRWKNDIQVSLTDPQLRDQLAVIDTRSDAVEKLKVYLAEAWSSVGPSFLESTASLHGDFQVPRNSSQVEQRVDEVAKDHVTNSLHTLDTVRPGLALEDPIQELPVERSNANADDPAQSRDNIEAVTSARRLPCYMERNSTVITYEEPPIEHPNTNADTPDPAQGRDDSEAGTSAPDPAQGRDDSEAGTSVHRSSRPSPSLMERNSTSEWNDSVDDALGGLRSKIQLPSPKRKKHSPLKKYEPAKIIRRRKAKKWSESEEDTFRAAVEVFGEGNWSDILREYSYVFKGRTTVDLKDKWRNLTRYGEKESSEKESSDLP